MTAANPPGPSAYVPANPTTGAPIVDPNDAQMPSVAAPNLAKAPGGSASGGYISVPVQVLSAILVELRVISTLLQANSAPELDLAALRADEVSSATGGVVN